MSLPVRKLVVCRRPGVSLSTVEEWEFTVAYGDGRYAARGYYVAMTPVTVDGPRLLYKLGDVRGARGFLFASSRFNAGMLAALRAALEPHGADICGIADRYTATAAVARAARLAQEPVVAAGRRA